MKPILFFVGHASLRNTEFLQNKLLNCGWIKLLLNLCISEGMIKKLEDISSLINLLFQIRVVLRPDLPNLLGDPLHLIVDAHGNRLLAIYQYGGDSGLGWEGFHI